MKTKQTNLFSLPSTRVIGLAFLFMMSVLSTTLFVDTPTTQAAANYCDKKYPPLDGASIKAKERQSELKRSCAQGYDTQKCQSIKAGAYTSKSEAKKACDKGASERKKDDTNTAATGAGNDCAGVETAIIKCDTNNKGGVEGNGIWALLLMAINILTAGVGVLAVGGIVYAAILYTTAEDKADQVKKAIDIIANVVIGLVAFALMYAGLNFLIPGGIFT